MIKKPGVLALHSFAGLVSGLFILLMSVSGSVLVFHEELDQWQYPEIVAQEKIPFAGTDSCYRSIQHQFPHAQINSCMLPESISQPYIISCYDSSFGKGEQVMQVFLHPQSAAVIGLRGGSNDGKRNRMGWLGSFHNSFQLGKKGEWLLGVFGLLFLLSLVTGLIYYRKNILSVLLFRPYVFRKSNLHQIIGVYALIFNLMIAITGIWMQRYVFKPSFYAPETEYVHTIKPSPPLHFSIEAAIQGIQKKYPDFSGYVVYFAPTKKSKTIVYGSRKQNAFIHAKKYADAVFLDSTGKITKTAFVNEIIPENRYDIINAQIHYGKFGGLPVKILYALFGLTGALLSITGFLIWMRKRN
ncbi:MAG: hypothetical protein RLZZ28_2554 [Bacteroidota bacterium]